MAHHTVRSGYQNLVKRLNRFPQGAPPSELLYRILEMLFSEKEAENVSLLPIKPFTAKTAAKRWKTSLKEARTMLDTLAGRGILLDIEEKGESVYILPPPMAGFFEFSMMRIRTDVNQKVLAELFYQYLNVEEDFIKALFRGGETQLGRVFVNEQALSAELSLHVLDYERATEVIRTATHIGVGICYCRHKMEHLGQACDAPQDICMTFNNTAASLTKHGIAREVSANACLDFLDRAHDHNLVQFGENVRERVNFICNCCKCCCEAMIAAQKFGFLNPVHTTNYLPHIAADACTSCGKCAGVCPVDAIELVAESSEEKGKKKTARLNEEICLGCGLCVRSCPTEAIKLIAREERIITPVNSTHKAVLMAIERGSLPDLIFDNRAHWNHRAMAAILGVILKLPPVKQSLASKQLRSRYLEYILL
ncbi:MAG TPA: 4Fe-4S binding protein [Syntrophales bacterium]|nr:4Fe-4S binding protein [Syntrophales bacterium]